MRQSPLSRIARALVVLAVLASSAAAHSWIEELDVIAPNGTFVGPPGYSRGNVPRTANAGDDAMSYKIPPNGRDTGNKILDTDRICKNTQQTMTQTDGSPRLQAAAGSLVALRYQENGHVTMPQNQPGKPANRGTVYVYGTSQSKPDDTLLAIHKMWNTAGTGGDGRGKLLTTQNYDDGQCYSVNPDSAISKARQAEFTFEPTKTTGTNLWCQNDLALPSDAPPGKPYTLYWVWDWPTAPNVDPAIPTGKPELYTTCMDIDITASSAQKDAESVQYVQGQNLGESGVASYVNELGKHEKIMVATESGQAADSSSSPPATSSAAAQASPSATSTLSTYASPPITSAAPVESSSQASSEDTDSVVTVYVTVSPTPVPFSPPYVVTGNSSPPAASTSSTAASPVSSSPKSAASTPADGSTCGATKVQKRSRILDGATWDRSPKVKSGYVRKSSESTTRRSAKFRHL